MLIFATVKPKTVLQTLRTELFFCSFVSVYLQRYEAIKSHLDAHTCMLYRSLARREEIASLFLFHIKFRLRNAKDQRFLFTSEQQYLTNNARRSEIRRIFEQLLSQRARSLCSAVYFRFRKTLSRSYQSTVQKNRQVLCLVDKTEQASLLGKRLYAPKCCTQFPLIIQLSRTSDVGVTAGSEKSIFNIPKLTPFGGSSGALKKEDTNLPFNWGVQRLDCKFINSLDLKK